VGDVQVGGRLIEQQHLRLLGERHGDPDPLALPARELVDGAIGEVAGTRGVQRGGDHLVVARVPARHGALVRVPAAPDEIRHRDALRRDGILWQQTQHARELLRRPGVDGAAVERHRPVLRLEQSRAAAQQRRLAAAVGADDRGDAAGLECQVETVEDASIAVGDAEPLGGQLVGCCGHEVCPVRFMRMRRRIR
jgi:hypothetical protein